MKHRFQEYRTSKNNIVVMLLVSTALIALGVYQVYSSSHMAAFKDEAAYFDTITQIDEKLASGTLDDSQASRLFYENQDKNMTSKYILENKGVFYIILGFYSGVGILLFAYWRRKKKLPHIVSLYVLAVSTVILTILLGLVSVFVDSGRNLFPPWADSLGIPLFGSIIALFFLVPIAIGTVAITTLSYRRAPFTGVSFECVAGGTKLLFALLAVGLITLTILGTIWPSYDLAVFIGGSWLYLAASFAGVATKDNMPLRSVSLTGSAT